MQNFIAITSLQLGSQQNEISANRIAMERRSRNGPLSDTFKARSFPKPEYNTTKHRPSVCLTGCISHFTCYKKTTISLRRYSLNWVWLAVVTNSSPPRQNSRHFANDIFKGIYNETLGILIKGSSWQQVHRIARFCNRTIVGVFIRQRLVAIIIFNLKMQS